MKALVVGGGGREHALAWALAKGSSVDEVHCAPGNPGMAAVAQCHPVGAEDFEGLTELAESVKPDLVVVGPEAPLAAGLTDRLAGNGIAVFGPYASGARLESSKAFAKHLMARFGIPTARSRVFSEPKDALAYIDAQGGPLVVKADGLAAGKGVTVCAGPADARKAVLELMRDRRFGDAGATVLIEERLEGEELSILALCDGKTVLPLPPAQDFKRALDGGLGSNTGGMGSYSPVPSATDAVLDEVTELIFEPLLRGLGELPDRYVGVIYAGLMLTSAGLKVIEFNCRFGDPEIQAVVPRLTSDLGHLLLSCIRGDLASQKVLSTGRACVNVVAASAGYPDASPLPTGFEISGLDQVEAMADVEVFHAATKQDGDRLVTSGGRVLSVSALGDGLADARIKAYQALAKINFDGMRYRRDIAETAARGRETI